MIPRYGMVLGNSKQYKCLFINSYFVLFHTVSDIPFGGYFLVSDDRGRKYHDADFLSRWSLTRILRGYLSYVARSGLPMAVISNVGERYLCIGTYLAQ